MIIVLAGTSEGREIARLLQDKGWPVLATATSALGREMLHQHGINSTMQEEFNAESLNRLIEETGASFLVDATHPFAQAISQLAIESTKRVGMPYLRLERASCYMPDYPGVININALDEVEPYLSQGMRVFSTLGSKRLPLLKSILERKGANLIARVLPLSSVIKGCEELGLDANQIVALKGPFSRELNRALFQSYQAELVVSKESGSAGGLDEKIQAAQDLDIPIVILNRPILEYPKVFYTAEALIKYIENDSRR